jgi:hypothetical protein
MTIEKKSYKNYGNPFSIFQYFSKIKRLEIAEIINEEIYKFLGDHKFELLDIGTADAHPNDKVQNIIVKKINNVKKLKIFTIDLVKDNFFKHKYRGSITDVLKKYKKLKSDVVVSSATIEHVGNDQKKLKMINNIATLTKKIFFITTPNRLYPIDFHTKIPIIHLLNKKIHRFLLRMLGFDFLSKEENLDLLYEKDVARLLKKSNPGFYYKVKKIKLFYIVSNFIIVGKKIV